MSQTEIMHYLSYGVGIFIIFMAINLLWSLYQNYLTRKMIKTGVLLEVVLEKDTEKDPFAIEQLWASFHGLYLPWYKRFKRAQPYISFEIKSEHDASKKKKEITFNFWVPEDYEPFLRQRLAGLYPNAQVTKLEKDYIPELNDGIHAIETAEVGLRDDSAFSLKTFRDFDSADPLNTITASMTELENKEIAIVQITAKPHTTKWQKKAERVLRKFEKTGKKPNKLPEWTNHFRGILVIFFSIIDAFLGAIFRSSQTDIKIDTSSSMADKERQKQILEKTRRHPFSFQIRVLVGTPLGKTMAKQRVQSIISSFKELDGDNGLQKEFIVQKNWTYNRMRKRYLSYLNTDDIVSTLELSSLCHLPNKDNQTPGLKRIQSKQAENPIDVTKENAFGLANFRGQKRLIGLDEAARMRHIYVSGMTGVGKSVLLENMIINDIETGQGAVVIDPHGELVDTILEKISADREDIFVLDPSDIGNPFGMNLLEISSTDPLQRELEKILVVDQYITVMKRIFGEASIGANTDDLFRMSCSAILDHPEGGGLLEMLLMLTSDTYRARVLQFVKDPIVRNYWEVVFPALAGQGKFLVQNLNAPLNKIRRFIANGLVANIICQKKSTLNVADAINNGSVILARFSRGDMGFENSALLGAMLIAKVQIAAMQRVKIPMEQRIPTYLYVDEFQNFVGDSGGSRSFAEILSEARKYKLGLIIANQFVDQLRQSGDNFLMSAIFNNCGTTITFRVGATDAQFFEQIYYDKDTDKGFKASDIANMDKYTVVTKIMTQSGVQSKPFTMGTLPPVRTSPKANPDLVRKRSSMRICIPRDVIRKSIEERMAMDTLADTSN